MTCLCLGATLIACGGGDPDTQTPDTADTAAAVTPSTPIDAVLAADGDAQGTASREEANGLFGGSGSGAGASVPGLVTVPYPTLQNLSIEWAVTGDENLNGVVGVRYRKTGTTAWFDGMALRRVPAGSNAGFSWANRHSGSIFDLQPNTSYDVQLSLNDPDGGSTVRTLTARTRTVPAPMANAPVKAVTPATFASVAASAKPGDILQLGAGTYPAFYWTRSGTAAAPIVIRSSAGAVINGNIDLFSQSHVHFSGLTVNGRIRFNNSSGIAITRCNIKTSGDGIVVYLRSENSYIADNVITGATVWASSSLGVNGNNIGEGVLVTGPGHVIMNNRIAGFRDAISLLEQSEAVDQFSIDILNNDLRTAADDAVEADYCFHNCRVMRNRVTDAFMGMSSQPSLGGPTYFIRNTMYNVVYSAFKLHNTSIGDVILHNSVVKSGDALGVYAGAPIRRAVFRNNLFYGGPGGTYGGYNNGSGRVATIVDLDTATSTLDYDSFGTSATGFAGRLGAASFTSLTTLRSATSEKHAWQFALSDFAAAVAYPSSPMAPHGAVDLRPKAGGALENRGLRLPNINDGYAGTAPDIGAHEVGSALPVYGPR